MGAAALVLVAPALASDAHPTLAELEGQVMCPICHTTLDQSNSAAAQRIKAFIVRRIRAGDSKSEIERRLVRDFGPAILAQPPKRGFDLLAWLLPIGGLGAGAVAVGFAFMGLLPWPERLVAPGLLSGARRSRSNVLLGGAFGVCAAPCIGPVLASTLALASNTSTVAQGSVLLLAYSAGLALPFLVTGVAFSQAMGAFRWLRDRYRAIQIGSGATLVALGLLLFFDRFWWLRVGLNRALRAVGLSS